MSDQDLDEDKIIDDLFEALSVEPVVESKAPRPETPQELVKFQVRMTRQERATLKMLAANAGDTMEGLIMGLVRKRLSSVSYHEFEALWPSEDKPDDSEVEAKIDQLRDDPYRWSVKVGGITLPANGRFSGQLEIQPADQADAYEEEADRRLARYRQVHGITCDLDNIEDV